MLPMRRSGHSGWRSRAARIGNRVTPNSARARRAHRRPAANSCTRLGTALATLCASSGQSSRASPGARSSAAATLPGNSAANVLEGVAGLNCESVGTFFASFLCLGQPGMAKLVS